MEKNEKRWQRRGLFALVSNRRPAAFPDSEEELFSDGEGEPDEAEGEERMRRSGMKP